jgi:DNA-directed RNA polymerase alpha subunit
VTQAKERTMNELEKLKLEISNLIDKKIKDLDIYSFTPNRKMFIKIKDLEIYEESIKKRIANALTNKNINYVGELIQLTEAELRIIKNLGKKSQRIILSLVDDFGFKMGLKFDFQKFLQEYENEKIIDEIRSSKS